MIALERYKEYYVCGYSGPSILSYAERDGIIERMCYAMVEVMDRPEILVMNNEILEEHSGFLFFRNRPRPVGRFRVIITGDKYCPPTRMYLGSKMMFQELYRETVRSYWIANSYSKSEFY